MLDGYKWSFEVLDESDYRLVLTYYASNKFFSSLLRKTLKRLEKKEGIILEENVLERFTIPEDQKKYMIPLLTKAVDKNIKYVFREVAKDGVVCINSEVLDAYYNKLKTEEWEVTVFIKGQYRI